MIITLCGSTKFNTRFVEVKKEFESRGIIVEMPPVFSKADNIILTKKDVHKLAILQYEKIRNSNAIYVVNCRGYIGEHTRKEIDLAKCLGVKIFYDE